MKAVKVRGQKDREKKMTYLITQSVLRRITHAELHLILSQIFNELAKSQQSTQPCALPPDDPDSIKEYLRRRRLQGPYS
jgi:hypothetical protein